MSASCTHVSAVFHALSRLAPATFAVHTASCACSDDDQEPEALPVTSLPCQWKPPRKRKHSTLPIAETTFEKHNYAK